VSTEPVEAGQCRRWTGTRERFAVEEYVGGAWTVKWSNGATSQRSEHTIRMQSVVIRDSEPTIVQRLEALEAWKAHAIEVHPELAEGAE
jgi:hypothetical protein